MLLLASTKPQLTSMTRSTRRALVRSDWVSGRLVPLGHWLRLLHPSARISHYSLFMSGLRMFTVGERQSLSEISERLNNSHLKTPNPFFSRLETRWYMYSCFLMQTLRVVSGHIARGIWHARCKANNLRAIIWSVDIAHQLHKRWHLHIGNAYVSLMRGCLPSVCATAFPLSILRVKLKALKCCLAGPLTAIHSWS